MNIYNIRIMKKLILVLFALAMCYLASAQILRPFSVRYNNPSVKGNIIQVANNIFTTVGGVDELVIRVTQRSCSRRCIRNNGTVGRNINVDALIPFSSNWKYLGSNWSCTFGWATFFIDAAWPSANGEFGYGDGDETTCITFRWRWNFMCTHRYKRHYNVFQKNYKLLLIRFYLPDLNLKWKEMMVMYFM